MNHKFSNQYRSILKQANWLAMASQQPEIKPAHLLRALVTGKGSIAFELLNKLGLVSGLATTANGPAVNSGGVSDLPLSDEVKQVIRQSVLIAAQYQHQYISTEHLLHSLLRSQQPLIKRFLSDKNFSLRDLDYQLKAVMKNTSKFRELTNEFAIRQQAEEEARKSSRVKSQTRRQGKSDRVKPKSRERLLDYFAVELTSSHQQRKLKPVVGRQVEIDRIIQILARLDKNNPVLLGEPGVGKTAIIEGLAKQIVAGQVPDVLLNKKIFSLDLSLLVAGAMYRGEFESRLKQLLEEISQDDDIIIFVDEIHNIVGAGSAAGTMDAANILKPALARGEIRLIGATTFEEYKKYIETDSALERRLQPVIVAEPSVTETVAILKGIRSSYEQHHGVKILNEALSAAAELSYRFLTEKFLPDKAIDLIDEAAAKVKVRQGRSKENLALKQLTQKLDRVRELKLEAVETENFPQALSYKEEERRLQLQLTDQSAAVANRSVRHGKIDAQSIADLISQITKIPAGDLLATEVRQLRGLETRLNRQIVGQTEAITSLAQAIKRSKTGLGSSSRPHGSFMFLGPSGVGKTETVKVLAKEIFGSPQALIRFDMSEFAEGFNISRLIGSPPGYVGFREGGQLTELVRRQPYAVILFDEIEKAHSEIFNALLQILDEGHLTDASGKQVDFKNTLIILTSNIGLAEFNQAAQIGFEAAAEQARVRAEQEYEKIEKSVKDSLKSKFRPEFLNRLDKILVFKPLSKAAIKKITALEIAKLISGVHSSQLNLKTDAQLVRLIAGQNYAPQEGARGVKRYLQDLVMAPLADKLLAGEIDKSRSVKISAVKDKVVFKQE